MLNRALNLYFCHRAAWASAQDAPGAWYGAAGMDLYWPEDVSTTPGQCLTDLLQVPGLRRCLDVLTYSDSVVARARFLVASGQLAPAACHLRVYVPTPRLQAHQRATAEAAGTVVGNFAGLWVGVTVDAVGNLEGWPGGGPTEDFKREMATLARLSKVNPA